MTNSQQRLLHSSLLHSSNSTMLGLTSLSRMRLFVLIVEVVHDLHILVAAPRAASIYCRSIETGLAPKCEPPHTFLAVSGMNSVLCHFLAYKMAQYSCHGQIQKGPQLSGPFWYFFYRDLRLQSINETHHNHGARCSIEQAAQATQHCCQVRTNSWN